MHAQLRVYIFFYNFVRGTCFVLSQSSRTELYDDVVDVTSFSALDVVEIKMCVLSLMT